jgi:hypothetical protein
MIGERTRAVANQMRVHSPQEVTAPCTPAGSEAPNRSKDGLKTAPCRLRKQRNGAHEGGSYTHDDLS